MSDVQPFQIDAISPLIRYNSVTNSSLTGWIPPTRANDAFYDPDIPYPFVTSANSSLSLNFFGTGVTVYGSIQLYPPSVCSYRVDLAPEGLFVLSSSDPFDGVLANFVNLTANQHTMTLTTQCNQTTTAHLPTNVTFSHADIYPWQSGYTVSNTQVVDDADSKALLFYHGSWQEDAGAPNPGGNYDASRHFTNSKDSFLEFTFWGSAIAINGSVGSNQGAYQVSHDFQPPVTYYANSSFGASSVVLYFAAGLDTTKVHFVNISNVGSPSYLEVDAFTVFNATTPIDSSDASDGVPIRDLIGGIIGGVIGGIAFLAGMAIMVWAICCSSRSTRRAMSATAPSTRRKRVSVLSKLFASFRATPKATARVDRTIWNSAGASGADDDIELAGSLRAGSSRGIDVEGLKEEAKKDGDGASKPLLQPGEATPSQEDPPPAYQSK